MRFFQLPLLAVFAAAAALSGCSPRTTFSVSHVPNPVLLGPVDRIGGHRAGGEKVVAPLSEEVSDFASVSTDSQQYGNTIVTTRTASAISVGNAVAIQHVLTLTEGRGTRDVRFDRMPAGAYFMVAGGAVIANIWVGLKGYVVEVPHAR